MRTRLKIFPGAILTNGNRRQNSSISKPIVKCYYLPMRHLPLLLLLALCGCSVPAPAPVLPKAVPAPPVPNVAQMEAVAMVVRPASVNTNPPVPIIGTIMPFQLMPYGCTFHAEASTDMVHWVEIAVTNGGGAGIGFITNLFDGPYKFYRGRWTRP